MLASRKLFDDSEAAHPITEDAYIKVENIRGRLLLIGAADDSLWDTAKYIRRMERRLAESARKSKNRHSRRLHHRDAGADGGRHVSGNIADNRHDAERLCLAGIHAGQKGRL